MQEQSGVQEHAALPTQRESWPRHKSRKHFLLPILLAGLACAGSISASEPVAAADSPAIKQRQDIFGALGEAVKEPGSMLRQEAPFDLGIVQASLKTIAESAPKLKPLFPENSKTGGNTEALPVIWEKKEPFLKLLEELATTALAARGAIKDEASFRAEWGKVSANCRACHKMYRVLPKN